MSALPSKQNQQLGLPHQAPATLVQSTVISHWIIITASRLVCVHLSPLPSVTSPAAWGAGWSLVRLYHTGLHIYPVSSFLTQSRSQCLKAQNSLAPSPLWRRLHAPASISQVSCFGLLGYFLSTPGTFLPQGLCTCHFPCQPGVFFCQTAAWITPPLPSALCSKFIFSVRLFPTTPSKI